MTDIKEPENWLDRKVAGVTVETAIYILFIVIAIASRFVMLGVRVQSHDESLHTRYSWELYNGDGFSHTPLMHGPFLFHATALSYWLFGDNDATARVPVAIMGVALVAIPYLFRRWLGRKGALVTSFFLLISPSILYYSRYIRMDIPVILFSLVLMASTWAYINNRKTEYLYWFAGALSLMFATKEVAFLYVAIFGSFLIVRIVVGLLSSDRWKTPQMRNWFQIGIIGLFLAVFIFSIGMAGLGFSEKASEQAAVDPEAESIDASEAVQPGLGWQYVRIIGGVLGSLALVLMLYSAFAGIGEGLHDYPEFDLIILYSTLLLPFMSPVPIKMLGGDPLDYTTEGIIRSLFVFIPIMALSIGVGVWWDWRRWLGIAAVFNGIFIVLFTTVFTNGQGFATGWFGSLGYWLDQQEVQRGGQPWYFYLFVAPIYEYLPLCGALAAGIYCMIKKNGLKLIGLFIVGEYKLQEETRKQLFGFVPFLLWWLALTWILYSYAGEKMGWLTVHLALPGIFLTGWFLGQLFQSVDLSRIWKAGGWSIPILLPLILAAFVLGIGPIFTGEVKLFSMELDNLTRTGRVLAGLLVLVCAIIIFLRSINRLSMAEINNTLIFSGFAFFSLLTVRTAWMASYINYDTAKEYIVYAHGAPGTKEVMQQVEDLSMRLHGDLSIKVAFDNDVSWPFWWYLRDYPNKVYFGENPSRDSLDVPVAIVGDKNWTKVEPYVSNRFFEFDYTLLWWPMEDYKGLTWERIKSALTDSQMREALWNIVFNRDYTRYGQVTGHDFSLSGWPLRHQMRLYIRKDIAAQLWDYGVGPSLAEFSYEDPYEDNFREDLMPVYAFGSAGSAEGQLQAPRGIAIGSDGLIYVADAGNNRIQVFNSDGSFVRTWGSLCKLEEGTGPCVDPDGEGPMPLGAGQFNEPWGIAISEDGVIYIADTWNHRIQYFTSGGEFLGSWGHFGQMTSGQSGLFYGPRDLAIGSDGLVYVTDTGNK
ncbi:MAG: TIGR03663 family protein, partial [Anaerolineales bacterium]|nr:TIGR03663 family protein [Anaerolineales bacterium]